MKLAMDTDAIVKLTKAGAKEHVAAAFEIMLPPAVRAEAIEQGKAKGHADALRIEEDVRMGRISISRAKREKHVEAALRDLRIAGGEGDALRLFLTGGADLVVTDDRRFLRSLEGLQVPYTTPASLLVLLVFRKAIGAEAGLKLLDRLSPFIGDEEYLVARHAMETR